MKKAVILLFCFEIVFCGVAILAPSFAQIGWFNFVYGSTLTEASNTCLLVTRTASPQNVQISISGPNVTISWDADPNAETFKVYSSDNPETGFTEDNSGFYAGVTWIAPRVAGKRFYYVTAIYAEALDDFVLVQGGTFSPNGVYQVSISSFYLDKYEVTQTAYAALMNTNPSYFTTVENGPVEKVSWFNALAYCNKLSISKGLTPCYSYSTFGTNPDNWPAGWNTLQANQTNITCNWLAEGYRLPTEMEWHFAARGGNLSHDYQYSGSNTQTTVAWCSANAGGTTHSVGTKPPNELGLFDMSGNVREWTWDAHAASYPTDPATDPKGPNMTTTSSHVYRGGDWNSNTCTVSVRSSISPTNVSYYQGFRICRNDFLGTVSTPVISPSEGTFIASPQVSISCATEDAEIRYTLNGSEPTASSTLYVNPFELSTITTVKARAFKPGWIASQSASALIRVIGNIPFNSALVNGGTFVRPTMWEGQIYYPEITVSPFLIDKFELTQDKFEAMMGYNPSYQAAQYGTFSHYPVDNVNWFEAIEYCNRRSLLEGLQGCYVTYYGTDPDQWGLWWDDTNFDQFYVWCDFSANGYRLPTRAEWEFAAMGGIYTHNYTYSGSNNIDDVALYSETLGAYNYWDANGEHRGKTSVNSKTPNELGIYLMSGNVSEIIWDAGGSSELEDVTDPTGPAYFEPGYRLKKGGNTNSAAWECEVFTVTTRYPIDKSEYTGFRIVRTAPSFGPVGMVTFSHEAGFHPGPIQVSLSTATPEANIHYTLDGSVPTANSPLYTAPISITESSTLKAMAWKDFYIATRVSEASFVIPRR